MPPHLVNQRHNTPHRPCPWAYRGDLIAALETHDLDFVIMGQPPPDLAADKVRIADHPHIIIAPPDHPLSRQKKIPLKDLTRETFLLRESTSGTRLLMQRLFDEAGLNPNLGMEIGSNETIKQAVMAGRELLSFPPIRFTRNFKTAVSANWMLPACQ